MKFENRLRTIDQIKNIAQEKKINQKLKQKLKQ